MLHSGGRNSQLYFPDFFTSCFDMPATVLTGIVTKAGVMAKTVTMTVEKVKMHPKLLKVCCLG